MFMWVNGNYIEQVKKEIYEDKVEGVFVFIKDDIFNLHSKMFIRKLTEVLAERDAKYIKTKQIWINKQEYDEAASKEFEITDTIEALIFENGKLIKRIKGSELKFDVNNIVEKILG